MIVRGAISIMRVDNADGNGSVEQKGRRGNGFSMSKVKEIVSHCEFGSVVIEIYCDKVGGILYLNQFTRVILLRVL